MNKLYKINQLDKKFARVNIIRKLLCPQQGWIATIRTTLEMSRAQLAKRLMLTRDAVQKMEQSETAHTITLATLEKAADAMDCDVHYVLLPKEKTLSNFITQRAKKIATIVVRNSAKHMLLEKQSAVTEINKQIDLFTDELLHDKIKNIWKYEI